jgi:hypothetical protein
LIENEVYRRNQEMLAIQGALHAQREAEAEAVRMRDPAYRARKQQEALADTQRQAAEAEKDRRVKAERAEQEAKANRIHATAVAAHEARSGWVVKQRRVAILDGKLARSTGSRKYFGASDYAIGVFSLMLGLTAAGQVRAEGIIWVFLAAPFLIYPAWMVAKEIQRRMFDAWISERSKLWAARGCGNNACQRCGKVAS